MTEGLYDKYSEITQITTNSIKSFSELRKDFPVILCSFDAELFVLSDNNIIFTRGLRDLKNREQRRKQIWEINFLRVLARIQKNTIFVEETWRAGAFQRENCKSRISAEIRDH